jgi:hypothetical protein
MKIVKAYKGKKLVYKSEFSDRANLSKLLAAWRLDHRVIYIRKVAAVQTSRVTMKIKFLKGVDQLIHKLSKSVSFIKTGFNRGYIEYQNKHIYGYLEGKSILFADELKECGCCGGCHQLCFVGDCRQDNSRFPTCEWAKMFGD